MTAFAEGVALNNKANEILQYDQSGSKLVEVYNKGEAALVLSMLRSSSKFMAMSGDTKVSSEPVLDGDSLASLPAIPGTVVVASSGFNDLKDTDSDGILYWDRVEGAELASGTDGATAGKTLTSAGAGFLAAGIVAGDTLALKNTSDVGGYIITAVTATTLVVSSNFPAGGQSSIEYSVFAQKVAAGSVDYFSGLLNLDYPAGTAPDAKGSVLGTIAPEWDLAPGDQLTVDIDAGGAAAATFDATQATLAGAAGTFAAMASETMDVRFQDGGVWGEWQTVVFGTEATQQLAVDLLNSQIVGGEARINGANIDLVSDGYGTGASVETDNVDAGITTKLGITDDGSQAGGGDVADINAVTFAEAKAIIEADVTDSLVTLDETGFIRITSDSVEVGADSKVQCGGIYAKFGLDNTLHTGADDGAFIAALASYINGTSVAAGAKVAVRMNFLDAENVSIRAAMNGQSGKVQLNISE